MTTKPAKRITMTQNHIQKFMLPFWVEVGCWLLPGWVVVGWMTVMVACWEEVEELVETLVVMEEMVGFVVVEEDVVCFVVVDVEVGFVVVDEVVGFVVVDDVVGFVVVEEEVEPKMGPESTVVGAGESSPSSTKLAL